MVYAHRYHRYEVIPATSFDSPLALIPVHSNIIQQDLWVCVSFDHVRSVLFCIG